MLTAKEGTRLSYSNALININFVAINRNGIDEVLNLPKRRRMAQRIVRHEVYEGN
jgi:hypothetical protein